MAEEDNVAAVDSSVCGQGQKAPDSSTSKVPVDGAAEHDLTIFFGRKNTSPVLKLVTARIVVEYGMWFQSICARPKDVRPLDYACDIAMRYRYAISYTI